MAWSIEHPAENDAPMSGMSTSTKSQRADEIIKFTNKDIYEAIQELVTVEDQPTRVSLLNRINAWVTSDGRTLFEYHADAVITSDDIAAPVLVSELWALRNEGEKSFLAGCSGKNFRPHHRSPGIKHHPRQR